MSIEDERNRIICEAADLLHVIGAGQWGNAPWQAEKARAMAHRLNNLLPAKDSSGEPRMNVG